MISKFRVTGLGLRDLGQLLVLEILEDQMERTLEIYSRIRTPV